MQIEHSEQAFVVEPVLDAGELGEDVAVSKHGGLVDGGRRGQRGWGERRPTQEYSIRRWVRCVLFDGGEDGVGEIAQDDVQDSFV